MTEAPSDFPAPYTKGDRVALLAGLGYILILILFSLFLYQLGVISIGDVNSFQLLLKAFGVMSLVILMNMANVYVYAYRFYEESFFLFLSLGWFANALYLVFEFFPPTTSEGATLAYSEQVFIFAILTNLPFYFALFVRREKPFDIRGFLRYTSLWAAALIVFPLLAWLIGDQYELSNQYRFMIFAVGGIILSAWLLYNVGLRLSARLTPDIHGRGATILPWTFYLYAALQFLYFCNLVPGWNYVMLAAFFFAFVLKVLNTLSVISILTVTRREFLRTKAQLEQRNVFEEIGHIASSIEHELKTPLGIMSLEIGRMRVKFQSQKEIVEALEKIDDERRRIFAISQIVPYLRGDKEFFERYMEKTSALEIAHKSAKTIKKDWKLDPAKYYFKVEGRDQFIKCHRLMLEQAVINLLKNSVEAIRHAKRKTGLVEIKIGILKTVPRQVVIEVADNGCGIAYDAIPQLTSLYTTKRHLKPNSGIGLFIANKIVKMHDGRIDIESDLGKSTSVRIVLPEWAETSQFADHTQPVSGVNLKPAQI